MRNKYIRFFISSTFADMKKERDLLREVMDNLANEYSQQGWQIETVDLRWGISEEAGLDNKTMQICLSELRHCQELSPKPNFIVLLGNRYGWIPLPEMVSTEDANLIKYNFNVKREGKELFNDWYKLDSNVLPNGMYVLQRRTGRFIDKEVWEKEVEYPLSDVFYEVVYGSQILKRSLYGKCLSKLFPRRTHFASNLLYGLSATELEIQHGALSVDDAKEHVIAYFREISDIDILPSEIKEEFIDTGRYYLDNLEKLTTLKTALKTKISKDNEFDVNVTWNEYQQENFSTVFKTEMEQRLRQVIEKSIKEASKETPETENQKHLGIADFKSKNFVGREVEIETIDTYINDSDNGNVFVIQGPSGSGKSALVAQTIKKYANTHDIICRFCGMTPLSSNIDELLKSVENDIYTLNSENSGKLPNLLSDIRLSKPLILIVDAINEIDKDNKLIFKLSPFKMKDENKEEGVPLSPNLKVIITTTEKIKIKFGERLISQYVLGNMGKDSLSLVSSICSSNGRRLTSAQYSCLNNIILSSDKSALYLTILGHYLSRIPSTEDISATPNNIIDLTRVVIDDLSKSENHGELVNEVLSLLSLERIGITDHEMLELLRLDEDFYHRFKEKCKQSWDDKISSIPPILWMRLKNELHSFLKEKVTEVGIVNAFFHNGIQAAFDDVYLTSEEKRRHFSSLLYEYYKRGEKVNNSHSIIELIRCGCIASKYANEKIKREIGIEIRNYLQNNRHFIRNIIRIAPINFLGDLDVALESINTSLEEIAYMREIIGTNVHGEQFRLALRNLPYNHIYREIYDSMEDSNSAMNNLLAGSYINSILYTCGDLGKNPCLNADGTKIAFIHDNGHEIRIQNISYPHEDISIPFEQEILDFHADEQLRVFAIKTKNLCIIYDSEKMEALQKYVIEENENVQISANGSNYMIYGENEFEAFVDYKSVGGAEFKGGHPQISPSGKYIWSVDNNYILCRTDIKSGHSNTFPIEEEGNEGKCNPLFDSNPCVRACTDNVCVLQYGSNILFISHFIDEISKKHQFCHLGTKFYGGTRFVVIDEIEKNIIIENNDMCEKYIIDTNHGIHYMSATFIGKIETANNSLSRALVDNKIIDLRKALQKFSTERGENCGINGISADYSGDHIMVASGINHNFGLDNQTDLSYILHGNLMRWLPPFAGKTYCYIAGVAISPNGYFVVVSSYGKTQLMLYSLEHQNAIKCYSDDIGLPNGEKCEDSFIGIKFSSDSQYVAAMIGHHISDGTPQLLCVLNQKGEVIRSYPHLGEEWVNHSSVGVTANNRYVYVGNCSCMIKDLIKEQDVTKKYEELPCDIFFVDRHLLKGPLPIKFIPLVVDNTACGSIITQRGGKMYVMDLNSETIKTYKCHKELQAASASGRFLFFVSNGELYMQAYPFNGDFISLYDNVRIVYPALDEYHIYIIQNNDEVILYNIRTKQPEQKAYNGGIIYCQVCAKGLACTDVYGRVSIFSPSDKYYVNKPAITTFVRRWNLENKIQEDPTAICPMCGGKIKMDHIIERVLIDNPREKKYEDWDNPKLLEYHCPCCGAELRFNPYIV